MRPSKPPVCLSCLHWHAGTLTCKAFPERIPDEILFGNPHTEAVPGDHGLRYTPRQATAEGEGQ